MKAKIILLTGGSGLIGINLINYFLKKDFKIITTVSKEESKSLLIKKFKFFIDKSLFVIKQNSKDENFEKKIFFEINRINIFPNILINNARDLKNLKVDSKNIISNKAWLMEFNMAVVAPYKLTLEFLKKKRVDTSRRVINMGSIYGTVAINKILQNFNKAPVPMHYSICKSALIHMTKEFAAKFGDKDITFNILSFGGVKGRENKSFNIKYSELSPNGRMLKLNEVIGALEFLISENSSGVNGHNLLVDGGWSIW